MHQDHLSRLAGYLYAAIEAGRATKEDWRAWADRMIETGVTPDWIIDLSLARSKEQATAKLEEFGSVDGDATTGHLAVRYLFQAIPLRGFLTEASWRANYDYAAIDEALERLDEGTSESTIFAELAPRLAPLVDEAERQWKELFPER